MNQFSGNGISNGLFPSDNAGLNYLNAPSDNNFRGTTSGLINLLGPQLARYGFDNIFNSI